MSGPPNPPSGRTAPARPQFKDAIPELVCKRMKPDGTLCGERFFTRKGYLSHGRSLKKHSAPGVVPPQPRPQTQAHTAPQQDDHSGLYMDGPASLGDLALPQLLDAMPYVELLDLQVQGARMITSLTPPHTHLLSTSACITPFCIAPIFACFSLTPSARPRSVADTIRRRHWTTLGARPSGTHSTCPRHLNLLRPLRRRTKKKEEICSPLPATPASTSSC